jgi:hypothetical protein
MKRLLVVLLGVVVAVAALPLAASADWSENFDSYVAGSGLHGQGGWKGWGNDPTWDTPVTDVISRSPNNSLNVFGNSDMVHEYSGYTSGKWTYVAWQYVPEEFTGQSYFILLNMYDDPGVTLNWSCQVQFDGTTDIVMSEFNGATLALIRGSWVELRVEIDLDLNSQSFYYGGSLLYTKSWTEGVSGGGALNIGAVDLFANGASTVYYDDMSLHPFGTTANETTTWGQVKTRLR